MMPRRLALVLTGLLLTGACDGQVVPPETGVPSGARAVPFEPIDHIAMQLWGPTEAARLVIRSPSGWDEFWTPIGNRTSPPSQPPAVDFTRHMVLVAAMGQRPTGGYQIAIAGVYEHEGVLFVDVVETVPAPGCLLTQALTAPMTAATVSTSQAEVEFVTREESAACN